MSGKAIAQAAAPLSFAERETYLQPYCLRDKAPAFLKQFVKVELSAAWPNGEELKGTCYVMPDYLSVGSDEDFVRWPLQPKTAQTIAQAWGCTLPTRKLVDAIYAAATVKLEPKPLTQARDSVPTFVYHNQLIQEQLAGKTPGQLVAGHKKDVVLTPRLHRQAKANRVAIYGWHKLDGKPIQPLYLGHVDWYTDYSHGIRLVRDMFEVEGQTYTLQQLLAHPTLHRLVCDEDLCEPVQY
ncbi:MAG: hypothetical protein ACO1OQ_16785 [Rufibacter sp.]